jgi:hypothetical protein
MSVDPLQSRPSHLRHPQRAPRCGWKKQFASGGSCGMLLGQSLRQAFDHKEWKWQTADTERNPDRRGKAI